MSDDLGAIQFHGEDDGGNKTLYAQIHGLQKMKRAAQNMASYIFLLARQGVLKIQL